ncbi:radical SAM protein [Sorangium sp. So ce134]
MQDKVFLLHSPIATPTEPPVGVSQLVGYLRAHGLDLTVADVNMAFFDGVMTKEAMSRSLSQARRRFSAADASPRLAGRALLSYIPLLQHASLDTLPDRIEPAISVFRDRERFFDFESYFEGARAAKSAFGLLSATLSPFTLDFAEVSSLLHNFDSSVELYEAIEEFQRIEDNVVLDVLNGALDATFRGRRPAVVGVSITYAHQFFFGMLLARLVRQRFPECYLALGGPLVATIANRGRKVGSFALFRDADAIAVSDGEVAFRTVIEHVLAGRPVPPTPNLIVYDRRTGEGGVPEVNVIEDIDEIPCPDFSSLPLDRYWSPTPVLPLPIARGCYWDKCTFCFYGFVPDGRRATAPYRERSVHKIVEDIAGLNRKHGCTHFDFTVDLVAPVLLDKLAAALPEAGLDVKWMLEARAEKNFTRERCRKLKAGGMTYAAFGLESMDQEVLDAISKGTKVAQYAATLSNFYNEGIATHAMGFFDFPGEDYPAALASIEFLKENDKHLSEVGWGSFILDIGSQVHRNAEKFGVEPIMHAEEDLATSVCHAPKAPSKSEEEQERLEALFEEYRLTHDKYSHLGRPFLGGGSLEPHCLIYYGKLGPTAAADFTRVVKRRLAPEVNGADRLRMAVRDARPHYAVKDVYRLFDELRKLLSDDKAGPVLTIGRRGSKSERVRRFDRYDKFLVGGEERRVLASPDQIVEVSESQWEVLSAFADVRSVQEVLDLYEEHAPRIQALLRKAVSYGWLEPVPALSC